jgi:O-antigen/teichoic acid export membrane protein
VLVLRGRFASLLRRPFVRDAGLLQTGTLAALGTSFLLAVVLARVLGPNGYGAYALVLSTMTTISLFKRLGQDYVATTSLATAYARKDGYAARRALIAFNVVNFWSTLLVIPPALLLAPLIADRLFEQPWLGESLRLALLPPVWAMVLGTVVILLQSSRQFGRLTILENGNTLALAFYGLLGALLAGVSGVFWGQLLASLTVAGLAFATYRWLASWDPLVPRPGVLAREVWRQRFSVGSEFRSGLAVALDKNLVSLYTLGPILLLGVFATTDAVGLLRVALSYLAVPLLALGAVSRLLMVKFPSLEATNPERVRRFFLQVTATAGGISILLTLPFVLLAPWLIGLLYGSEFERAAGLVPLLALDPLLAGFGIAAGPIFRTFGRNLWAVYANLFVLGVGLPFAYWATQNYGLAGAALSYAGLVTALRLVSYLLCLRIVSR